MPLEKALTMNRMLLMIIVAVVIIAGVAVGVVAYNYTSSHDMRIISLTSSINPYEVLSNQSGSILPPSLPHFNVSIYSKTASNCRIYITSPLGTPLELYNEPVIGNENISEPIGSVSKALSVYAFFSKPGNFTVTAELFKNSTIVEKNITEVIRPQIVLSNITGPKVLTGNETGRYSLTANGGVQPYRFKWNLMQSVFNVYNLSSTSNNTDISLNNTGNWTVSVEITDSLGFYATTYVNVRDYANPTISPTYNPVDVEVNDTFKVNTYGSPENYTYRWEVLPQDKYLGSTDKVTYSFSNPGDYIIKVLLTDSTGKSINASLNLTVSSPPIVKSYLEFNTTDISSPGTNFINCTISGGVPFVDGQYNYSVYINGTYVSNGLIFSGSVNSIIFSDPYEAGKFNVVLVVSDRCNFTVSGSMVLVVNPILEVFISMQGSASLGSEVTLLANINGGTGPYNFTWGISYPNLSFSYLYSHNITINLADTGQYYIYLDVTDHFFETYDTEYTITVGG